MKTRTTTQKILGFAISRRGRRLTALIAALPLCQATGCFPDPLGALNFELQSLINSVLINTVTIIVQNLLGL